VQVIVAVDLARSLDFYERAFALASQPAHRLRELRRAPATGGGAVGLYQRAGFAGEVGPEPVEIGRRGSAACAGGRPGPRPFQHGGGATEQRERPQPLTRSGVVGLLKTYDLRVPKLTGISPVLLVADLRRAVAFYRDRLGFECQVSGDPPNFATADRDVATILLAATNDSDQIVPHWQIVDKMWNAYIRVDDVDAIYA